MKLHTAILKNIINISHLSSQELRGLLDDLGLEVKGVVYPDNLPKDSQDSDPIFTIETLANRGDHLGALGAAREISAWLLTPIKVPQAATELPDRKVSLPISIDTSLCLACGFLELALPPKMELPSEVLVAAKVQQVSAIELHPIVKLLNYIQLESGQPMHAFDRDKIEGSFYIDVTTEEEEVVALNGKTYKLSVGTIVNKDSKKIIGITGIIGCANSMVTPETKRVLIEAGSFDPVAIRKTARKIALVTEASHAFERGTDRENILYSLRRVIYLAQGANRDGTGCQPLGSHHTVNKKTETKKITVRLKRFKEEVNLPRLTNADIVVRLKYLGYGVAGASESDAALSEITEKTQIATVTVPTWRVWDVESEMDVIEDYINALGLNKVKLEVPLIEPEVPKLNSFETVRERLEPALIGAGFCEAITKGFYSNSDIDVLEGLASGTSAQHIRLKNSVESSFAAMKMTNAIHLAELSERNLRFGVLSPKTFEFGRVFRLTEGSNEASDKTNRVEIHKAGLESLSFEREVLTLAVAGKWSCTEWGDEEKLQTKLMLFKGVVENLFSSLNIKPNILQNSAKNPTKSGAASELITSILHPGYSAIVKLGSKLCGGFGLLHPQIKRHLNLKNDVLYAEFDVEALYNGITEKTYVAYTQLPAIRRDFTLKLKIQDNADQVIKIINGLKLENLSETSIVDDFVKAEEQFRRVSYRLRFQREDRTLQHEEVNSSVDEVLAALREKGVDLV